MTRWALWSTVLVLSACSSRSHSPLDSPSGDPPRATTSPTAETATVRPIQCPLSVDAGYTIASVWRRCSIFAPVFHYGGFCLQGEPCMRPCRVAHLGEGGAWEERFAYDAGGRLVRSESPGPKDGVSVAGLEYDRNGRLTALVVDGQPMTKLHYDQARSVSRIDDVMLGERTQFRYGADGRLEESSTDDIEHERRLKLTRVTYDAKGRLRSISETAVLSQIETEEIHHYDADGRLRVIAWEGPLHLLALLDYDARGRVSAIWSTASRAPSLQEPLSDDDIGAVRSLVVSGKGFAYDAQDRLVMVKDRAGDSWIDRQRYEYCD